MESIQAVEDGSKYKPDDDISDENDQIMYYTC